MSTAAPPDATGAHRSGGGTVEVRDPVVDGFRGLAVLLMALGNVELGVRVFPAWLKHTPDIGFTVADLVAPMFVVAIALTVGPSMRRRRVRDGGAASRWHLAERALILLGIGAVISAGQAVVHPAAGVEPSWGVLQCLGASTLLLLPVVFAPPRWRVVLGLCLLGGYQLLLDQYWLETVLRSSHNGLLGTLSWAGLLMVGSGIGDAYHDARDAGLRLLVVAGGVATAVALLLSGVVEVSKARASATYMLLSLGLSLLVLAVVHLWLHARPHKARWLQRVGRNPLILYLVNLVLLAVLTLPPAPWWYELAPLWLTLVQMAAIAATTVALAGYLDRRGVVLSL